MDVVEAKKQIKQRWIEQWALVGAGAHYVFDNNVDADADVWVRVRVNIGKTEPWSLGQNGRNRRNGTIEMAFHRPLNEGDKNLDTMAKLGQRIFERKRIGVGDESINCWLADWSNAVQLGRHWRVTVTVSFWFLEPRS
jgi:hypothetical protein